MDLQYMKNGLLRGSNCPDFHALETHVLDWPMLSCSSVVAYRIGHRQYDEVSLKKKLQHGGDMRSRSSGSEYGT